MSITAGRQAAKGTGNVFDKITESLREKDKFDRESNSELEQILAALGKVSPDRADELGIDLGQKDTKSLGNKTLGDILTKNIGGGAGAVVSGVPEGQDVFNKEGTVQQPAQQPAQPGSGLANVIPSSISETTKDKFTGSSSTVKADIIPPEAEIARQQQEKAEETFAQKKAAKAGGGEVATNVLVSESANAVDTAIKTIFDLTGNDPENESFTKAVNAVSVGRTPVVGKAIRFGAELGLKENDKTAQQIILALDTIENEFVTSKGGKQLTRTEIEFIQRRLPSLRRSGDINFEALEQLQVFVQAVRRRIDGAESLGFQITEEGFERKGQLFTAEQIESLMIDETQTPEQQGLVETEIMSRLLGGQ